MAIFWQDDQDSFELGNIINDQDAGNTVQRRAVPAAFLLQYLGEDVSRQTYQAHRAHGV